MFKKITHALHHRTQQLKSWAHQLISEGTQKEWRLRRRLHEVNGKASEKTNKLLNHYNIANSDDFSRLNQRIAVLASKVQSLATDKGLSDVNLERRKKDRRSKKMDTWKEKRFEERRLTNSSSSY